MAAKKRGGNVPSKADDPEPRENHTVVAPPQKSLWQLIVSGILVVVWLIFLAWMAFTG
jgi:hypothetical protein